MRKTGSIGSHVQRVDQRGATVRLSREEWGVVIDALIEHKGSSERRHAVNPPSTSDERADTCSGLIGMIGGALS